MENQIKIKDLSKELHIGDVIGTAQAGHEDTLKPIGPVLLEVVTNTDRLFDDIDIMKKDGSGSLPGGFRGTKLMTIEEHEKFIKGLPQ